MLEQTRTFNVVIGVLNKAYFERVRSDFLTSNNISQIELRELQLGFVIKSQIIY